MGGVTRVVVWAEGVYFGRASRSKVVFLVGERRCVGGIEREGNQADVLVMVTVTVTERSGLDWGKLLPSGLMEG